MLPFEGASPSYQAPSDNRQTSPSECVVSRWESSTVLIRHKTPSDSEVSLSASTANCTFCLTALRQRLLLVDQGPILHSICWGGTPGKPSRTHRSSVFWRQLVMFCLFLNLNFRNQVHDCFIFFFFFQTELSVSVCTRTHTV